VSQGSAASRLQRVNAVSRNPKPLAGIDTLISDGAVHVLVWAMKPISYIATDFLLTSYGMPSGSTSGSR